MLHQSSFHSLSSDVVIPLHSEDVLHKAWVLKRGIPLPLSLVALAHLCFKISGSHWGLCVRFCLPSHMRKPPQLVDAAEDPFSKYPNHTILACNPKTKKGLLNQLEEGRDLIQLQLRSPPWSCTENSNWIGMCQPQKDKIT